MGVICFDKFTNASYRVADALIAGPYGTVRPLLNLDKFAKSCSQLVGCCMQPWQPCDCPHNLILYPKPASRIAQKQGLRVICTVTVATAVVACPHPTKHCHCLADLCALAQCTDSRSCPMGDCLVAAITRLLTSTNGTMSCICLELKQPWWLYAPESISGLAVASEEEIAPLLRWS